MVKLFIKNMVCNRCVMVVREELEKLKLEPVHVTLGEAEIQNELTPESKNQLQTNLAALGFELLDDRKSRLVEKIKNAIIEIIHYGEDLDNRLKFSKQIEQKVGVDYHQLSTLFSETEGITIEKYIILQRIEKVKELLVYNEFNLSEIAFRTGYSSVQHLSAQFKKVTGLTPSHFRQVKDNKRKPLDQV
ncbi:MAG TPA: AraC family transcriptional regulator [Chitinophagaceae bacterium]